MSSMNPIARDETATDFDLLGEELARLRGNPNRPPDASVVVPVNARTDLQVVLSLLSDVARYRGQRAIEVVVVINNYPPDRPPDQVESFRRAGMRVVAVPDVHCPGVAIILSARAHGIRAATSEVVLNFDADCRISAFPALLEWYVNVIHAGSHAAYTRVEHFGLPRKLVTRVRRTIHRTSRWTKRVLLRIPTTRGSNYALRRSTFLRIYDGEQLSSDIQVGPAVKLAGEEVSYSGDPALTVLTSGRKQSGSWFRLLPYLWYRLRYNVMAIPRRRREVTRTSWDGFERETELRQKQPACPPDRES